MAPTIMGIVNLTCNSFVESSRMAGRSLHEVLQRIQELSDDGAGIIDIGACSTAPGNRPVSEEEEWKALGAALPEIFRSFPSLQFSLDTFRSGIVRKALAAAGREFIVNDISAGQEDAQMLPLVASEGLRYVATDRSEDPYGFFQVFAQTADRLGIRDWILDPGFGFGKSVERCLQIMDRLERFQDFSRPVLVGISRKRMIQIPCGLDAENCAQQSVEAEVAAAAKGASIIRTHDVALLRQRLSQTNSNS